MALYCPSTVPAVPAHHMPEVGYDKCSTTYLHGITPHKYTTNSACGTIPAVCTHTGSGVQHMQYLCVREVFCGCKGHWRVCACLIDAVGCSEDVPPVDEDTPTDVLIPLALDAHNICKAVPGHVDKPLLPSKTHLSSF